MNLGIFIGSFDPVHKGHRKIIDYLLNHQYVDNILIVPTINYWKKEIQASLKDRIEMLKLLETDKIKVDTTHNHYQYTYELLKALERETSDKLFLILGADQLEKLDQWKNIQELLKYPMIIMNRNQINCEEYVKKYKNNHFVLVNDFIPLDISSTDIRNHKKKNLLDKKVAEYIKKKHLYEK